MGRLDGKRVLVTQADDYMGPATVDLFTAEGADVVADITDLTVEGACDRVVADAGRVDILIANLASENFSGTAVLDLPDADWHTTFAMMVHPLHKLTQAVLPQMIERRRGKIVVYGSAVALKGLKTVAAYSAARAAQAEHRHHVVEPRRGLQAPARAVTLALPRRKAQTPARSPTTRAIAHVEPRRERQQSLPRRPAEPATVDLIASRCPRAAARRHQRERER